MILPITYYGGKQNMLKHILPRIPEHSIYVEPFLGGGAVFLSKDKSKNEIINDNDERIVNFFRVCQDKEKFDELLYLLEYTPYSEVFHKEANNIINGKIEANDIKRAWAFFVSVNIGYGGIMDRSFGYGQLSHKLTGKYYKKKKKIANFIDRFNSPIIFNRDAFWVIEKYNVEEAFMFIDPPYYNSRMNYMTNFSEQDFKELLDLLSTLKAKFMLTTYPSDILDEYIEQNGWHSERFEMIKFVSLSKKNHNKTKIETITTNYTDYGFDSNKIF